MWAGPRILLGGTVKNFLGVFFGGPGGGFGGPGGGCGGPGGGFFGSSSGLPLIQP